MVDGPAIDSVVRTIKPIVVPEGKFAAPGDFQIQNVRARFGATPEVVPLIKQTFAGNCAEYTTLDTAIVLSRAGLEINGAVFQYLHDQPRYGLPTVENDLTIPLVLQAQENIKTLSSDGNQVQFPVGVNDVDNLDSKSTNPYEPLTNTNSALLFREVVCPSDKIIDPTDFATTYSDAVGRKLVSRDVQAILIGSGNHATSIVKLRDRFIHIDPYNNADIIKELTLEQARNLLATSLARPNAFVTFNAVRRV